MIVLVSKLTHARAIRSFSGPEREAWTRYTAPASRSAHARGDVLRANPVEHHGGPARYWRRVATFHADDDRREHMRLRRNSELRLDVGRVQRRHGESNHTRGESVRASSKHQILRSEPAIGSHELVRRNGRDDDKRPGII